MAPATKSGWAGSAESFYKNCQQNSRWTRVDELEIEEVFARNTKVGGASRYNPIMLLKVLIYCHMTGTYSSRQKKPLLGLFVGAYSTVIVIGFVSEDVAMTIIWIPLLTVMEKKVTNLVKDEKKEKTL